MKKEIRNTCYTAGMFFTGRFIWKFVVGDYEAGCVMASITIALLVVAYIMARWSNE